MMNDVVQAFGSPGERRQGAVGEPLGEDPARTQDRVALKTANHHPQLDAAAAPLPPSPRG